ncbi:hypothetical protein P2G88_18285 [Aliiglaciecola sp. CAU 1673]|uniref:hypothetical protein n=1 Tax=Aliiglaciecola sp. CAU 1673 TaxID=3032595 RepID=UPI0023DBF3EE|nr:hypothetical protein [Aliiglaciecola sp. CAU 1673]MDF2180208.1 hypothetical protein [Aliiglaciecola sp. CAU 1673]
MNIDKKELNDLMEQLKQHRDELNVKLHLGKAELKDEWKEVEARYETMQSKYKALKKDTAESSKEIGAALSLVADEIGEAYQRLKKRLQD